MFSSSGHKDDKGLPLPLPPHLQFWCLSFDNDFKIIDGQTGIHLVPTRSCAEGQGKSRESRISSIRGTGSAACKNQFRMFTEPMDTCLLYISCIIKWHILFKMF